MNNFIVFRLFKTYEKNYVYDRHMNAVIMIDDIEYEELKKVADGKLLVENSSVIHKYQEQGLFKPNVVEKIWHPQTNIMEHHAEKRLRQLTLQVTQQCNLRCAYCAYSGIYNGNRTHANKRMEFETAKKAIDFFLEHSIESSEIVVGFYGGEPLLEFELIKQCVQYVNTKIEGKKVSFNMTTNGTLLKGDIAKFLVENNFDIGISLDGSKREHDISRKFVNGEGSFDIVINNIKMLMDKYPQYEKEHINIMTTVNPYMDLGCVLEYFSSSDIFSDKAIMFNTMVPTNLSDGPSYKESYFQIRKYEYIKMLFSMIKKLDKKYVSPLMSSSVSDTFKLRKSLHRRLEMGKTIHHGGPCMPGILRLFVRYDGALFPCERVNEELQYYQIGTVEQGFDVNRMKALLNIGELTEKECINCWNLRQCLMCSNEIEFGGKEKPSKKCKLEECLKKKQETQFQIYEQSVLSEFGYKGENIWI